MGMIKMIALWLVMGVGFYLLYSNGYLAMASKRAVMYVGSKRGKAAKFSSCSGYTKRIIKVQETKQYRFSLDCNLTAGTILVEVLDTSKKPILSLDETHRCAAVNLEKGKRYDLIVRFEAASGDYVIDWN
jgi:uncharacterized protein YdaL